MDYNLLKNVPRKGIPVQSYSGDGIESINPNSREGSGFLVLG